MSIKSGDFVIYECPATFDEKGTMEIELKIVKIKSLLENNNFKDEEENIYDEYRVKKIIRDDKHIDNDLYDYGRIVKDTKYILEKRNTDDQSSSL